MVSILLKKGKEKAVLHQHPWIFSGALQNINGNPENGDLVAVHASDNRFLAYGYYNKESRVAVRLLSWDENTLPDEAWYRKRIQAAVNGRAHLLTDGNDTCRLVFSESDYLPGLIVDKYGDYLSVQISTSGIEKMKDVILDELQKLTDATGVFDKSDAISRAHDGLEAANGLLAGTLPPDFLEVQENGIKYHINIIEGQKSGFYCDQRFNRQMLANYVKGKEVLDCFSYSGGFTLNALVKGAQKVTAVDSSALALETLKQNLSLNNFSTNKYETIQSDVNKQLRIFKENEATFDVVILDPPKYAPSRSALTKASRAYKDLNRLGMQVLKHGGLLATFSCSGAVDIDTFKQIVAWAALDAGKEVQIIYQFSQPEDHPIRISFPEGEYLKGLLCRVY